MLKYGVLQLLNTVVKISWHTKHYHALFVNMGFTNLDEFFFTVLKHSNLGLMRYQIVHLIIDIAL